MNKMYQLNLVACTLYDIQILGPLSDIRPGDEAYFIITDVPGDKYVLSVRCDGNWMALQACCDTEVHRNVIFAEMVRCLRLAFAVHSIEMPILETTNLRAWNNFGKRNGTPIEDTPAPEVTDG